jgi:hypothetical protein
VQVEHVQLRVRSPEARDEVREHPELEEEQLVRAAGVDRRGPAPDALARRTVTTMTLMNRANPISPVSAATFR